MFSKKFIGGLILSSALVSAHLQAVEMIGMKAPQLNVQVEMTPELASWIQAGSVVNRVNSQIGNPYFLAAFLDLENVGEQISIRTSDHFLCGISKKCTSPSVYGLTRPWNRMGKANWVFKENSYLINNPTEDNGENDYPPPALKVNLFLDSLVRYKKGDQYVILDTWGEQETVYARFQSVHGARPQSGPILSALPVDGYDEGGTACVNDDMLLYVKNSPYAADARVNPLRLIGSATLRVCGDWITNGARLIIDSLCGIRDRTGTSTDTCKLRFTNSGYDPVAGRAVSRMEIILK